MLIALRHFTLPALQSGASQLSQLWLWAAAALVAGWSLNHWLNATPARVPAARAFIAVAEPSSQRGLPTPALRHSIPMATDLGSLIATARESSSIGSHYRALRALDFCARQARHLLDDRQADANDPTLFSDPRQAAALMQLRALCARDAATATLDYFSLTEEGLERPDPILSLALRLERLSAAPHESLDLQDATMRRDLITRIFAMQEPALLGDLADELSLLGPRLAFTVAGVAVEPEAHPALIAALRDLACGSAGCFEAQEQLLRCAAAAQCDTATDSSPNSWQRMRFLALLQLSGGRALDFSYRPAA